MRFTNEEAYDMLAVYFECMQNTMIAARTYALRYADRRHPNRRTFSRIAHRLRTTGSIHSQPLQRRRKTVCTEDNIINVLAYIQTNPHVSTRKIEKNLGVSRTTTRRILKQHR